MIRVVGGEGCESRRLTVQVNLWSQNVAAHSHVPTWACMSMCGHECAKVLAMMRFPKKHGCKTFEWVFAMTPTHQLPIDRSPINRP